MTTDDLYRLVSELIPQWFVAVLSLLATIALVYRAKHTLQRRILYLALGCFNFAALYTWSYLSHAPIEYRAATVRIAIVILMLTILLYNTDILIYLAKKTAKKLKRL